MARLDLGEMQIEIDGTLAEFKLLAQALNAAIAGGEGCQVYYSSPKQIRIHRVQDLEMCKKCGVRLRDKEPAPEGLCHVCTKKAEWK